MVLIELDSSFCPSSGSDFHNGIVGFSLNSLMGQVLDEDSAENRTVLLYLQRQENR